MTCLGASLALAAGLVVPGEPVGVPVSGDWAELASQEPGPERGRRIAAQLIASGAVLSHEAQVLAFEAGSRAADALELDLALTIQEELHARVGAVWSGFNLALTQHRAGDTASADATLAAFLPTAGPGDRANLWNQRAIFALGEGRHGAARAYFGRSLALGSADATAILAREHLAGHNLTAARTGFRASLNRNPDHPWALRGWGLALLSAPQPRDRRHP